MRFMSIFGMLASFNSNKFCFKSSFFVFTWTMFIQGYSKLESDSSFSMSALFPRAHPRELIRSSQKDHFYVAQLQSHVESISSQIAALRPHAKFIKLLTALSYFALSTLSGQTLGEESLDMGAVYGDRWATYLRRMASVVSTHLVPLALQRLKIPNLKDVLDMVGKLHLAQFYFFGVYYNIANRVFGLKHV
jgi:hypothetical protein